MKLYFQHADGFRELICETDEKKYLGDALKDLHKRDPNYKTYYQRCWEDKDGFIWVDVGSHTQYYVIEKD